jgi:endonuclease-3
MAQILKDQYEGDPPEDYDNIIKLPGIGPKMAYLYLQCCCGKVEGIAVDTHVHRICNRLNWVSTKNPEETRKNLQSWMPKEYWDDVNTLLVGLGQMICEAKKPKCDECKLYNLCDFRINNVKPKSKSSSKVKKNESKDMSKSKEKLLKDEENIVQDSKSEVAGTSKSSGKLSKRNIEEVKISSKKTKKK